VKVEGIRKYGSLEAKEGEKAAKRGISKRLQKEKWITMKTFSPVRE